MPAAPSALIDDVPVDSSWEEPVKKSGIFTDEQKLMFLRLKQIGRGNARACSDMGVTVSDFARTCSSDPDFVACIKTYEASYIDECEEILYRFAVDNNSIFGAEKYLAHRRAKEHAKKKLLISREELKLKQKAVEAVSQIDAKDEVDRMIIDMSGLSDDQLKRYNDLYMMVLNGNRMNPTEALEYVSIQQMIMSVRQDFDVGRAPKKLEGPRRGRPPKWNREKNGDDDGNWDDDE